MRKKEHICSKWRVVDKKTNYVRIKDKNGTWQIEHRLIMEEFLGRKLKSIEQVHHIDHNKSNNKIENLLLCKNSFNHKSTDSFIDLYKLNNIDYKITKNRLLIFPSDELLDSMIKIFR